MGPKVRGVFLAMVAVVFAGCAPAPPPVTQPKPDPAAEAWYGDATQQLATLQNDAERLFQNGKFDDAAALVTQAQPLQRRLLSAPRPTLAAMRAVADLDDLYGRMLLRDKKYGWARTFFQNNVVRWRTWKPQTAETLARSKKAAAALADCERRLSE